MRWLRKLVSPNATRNPIENHACGSPTALHELVAPAPRTAAPEREDTRRSKTSQEQGQRSPSAAARRPDATAKGVMSHVARQRAPGPVPDGEIATVSHRYHLGADNIGRTSRCNPPARRGLERQERKCTRGRACLAHVSSESGYVRAQRYCSRHHRCSSSTTRRPF